MPDKDLPSLPFEVEAGLEVHLPVEDRDRWADFRVADSLVETVEIVERAIPVTGTVEAWMFKLHALGRHLGADLGVSTLYRKMLADFKSLGRPSPRMSVVLNA